MSNRVIKFRAWDKPLKKYFYPKLWDRSMPTNWEDFMELEQFTGLTDSKGVEIYVGDFVIEGDSKKDFGSPLLVCFGEVALGRDDWGMNYVTTGFYLKYPDGSVTGIHTRAKGNGDYGFNSKDLTVIGNLHQHPELLKD